MLTLRPYQIECLEAIKNHASLGYKRQLINLPTASGKTVIFSHLIKETKLRTLVLAHTCELLQQAKDKINMICPELDVGIVNATTKEFDKDVVICSIQSARVPANLSKLKKREFELLIFDECHHAAADTPKNVLDSLGFGKGTINLLVGFTATAFRSDEKGLGEIFDVISYEKNTKDLIDAGYLSPPIGIKVATDIDLSKVKTGNGDFQATSLASVMDTVEINQLIVDSYINKGEGRKALCFGVTVQHAHVLSHLFRLQGISSQPIYGNMPRSERDGILEDFKEGHIQVLCNCQVLTEGFDAPDVSCVIIARPTRARGLYQQMVGRGLRLYPNKKDCLVLDLCDKNHSICNAAILLQDAEVVDTQEKEKEEREEVSISSLGLPPTLNQELKSVLINFDPLGKSYVWNLFDRTYFLKGSNVELRIEPTGDDRYRVILSSVIQENRIISDGLDFEYSFAAAEDFAKKNRKIFAVSDREAEWRNQPISEKQASYINSCGYSSGVQSLSKGQACDLISSGSLRRTG